MKNKFKSFSILILSLVFILSMSITAFAKTLKQKPGDAHKTWTIKFNKDVDANTAKDNITVEDSKGNLVNATIEASGTVARVKPPVGGYAPGEYTIKVADKIKSTTGKRMKDSCEMKFTVSKKISNEIDVDIKVNGTLKVHYIDVGQADAILIQQGNHNMLIDAGNNTDSDLVTNYLKQQEVEKLDYVIGTHPHEDHIGGLDTVINSFDVEKVLMPEVTATTNTYKDVITAIQDKNLKITAPNVGDSYDLGGANWTILAPNSNSYEDTNNYSIVIKLKFGNNSFIFTGDAEDVSEGEVLAKQLDIQADVLKVGHHGSSSSTTDSFLNAVNPKYAVILCGKDNKYGHPMQSTMDKLKAKNIEVYRTDENGTIVATSNGEDITFNTDPGSYNGNEDKPIDNTDKEESNANVQITNVDLEKEIVTIKNNGSNDVDMIGWKLVSVEGNQTYDFPAGFTLKAGATIYITSGRGAKDDGVNYLKWTGAYIWNNDGDTAQLYNVTNELVSSK